MNRSQYQNLSVIILIAVLPLLIGAYCSVALQNQPTWVSERATAFARGEYPDPILSEVLRVTPFITPTLTVTTTQLIAELPADDDPAPPDPNQDDSEPPEQADQAIPPTNVPPPATLIAVASVTAQPSTTPPPPSVTPQPSTTPIVTALPSATVPLIPPTVIIPTSTRPPSGGDDDNNNDNRPPAPTAIPTELPVNPTEPPLATPTIDPNSIAISFEQSHLSADEASGRQPVAVILSQASSNTISVGYNTSDGTASSQSDYAATSGTLIFSPGQLTATFTVPITDDLTDDPAQETVNLALSGPTNAVLGTANASLSILDNDEQPNIQFEQATIQTNEDTTPALAVVLSHPSGQFVSLSYGITTASATAGQDYEQFSLGTIGFGPDATGVSPTTVRFDWTNLIDDTNAEADETIMVSFIGTPLNADAGTITTTTITIIDNDNLVQ